MKKSMVIISIVLLLGLGSTALVLGGAISKSLNGHTASYSNESQTSSARINSGNTSNSFFLGMNVIPTIRLIPLGGNANFTVVLYNGGDLTGNYSLSAAVPPGFSFAVAPPVSITG